jgi:hypothetical protein
MSSLLPAFIHTIESPSSQDLLENRFEGTSLMAGFQLSNIAYSYNLVTDRKTFYNAFGYRLNNAYEEYYPKVPIFHLSMHGNESCIALTNGECITWNELYTILSPINQNMNGNLLLCMSSCSGIYSFNMNYSQNIDLPILAFVGSDISIPWSDAAIAYATFYHLLFKGTSLQQCVEAMRIASGNNNFHYILGKTAKNTATLNHLLNNLSNQKLNFIGDFT